MKPVHYLRIGLVLVFVIIGSFILINTPSNPISRNFISIQVLQASLREPDLLSIAQENLYQLSQTDCHAYWTLGVISKRLGDNIGKERAWQHLLDCSKDEVSMLLAIEPKDLDLAQRIVRIYPDESAGWFRWGELVKDKDLKLAEILFTKVVEINPSDGLAWCRLGLLHEISKQWEIASDDYLSCCRNGDPGYNGCAGAGRVMEKSGNLVRAIEYYRLSRYKENQEKADELEKQINP